MGPIPLKQPVQFEPRPFLIGSVMVGVGALLAFIGLAIGGLHSVNQGIRWARSWEQGPGDLAKTKWAKLKTAGAASTAAWKGSAPPALARDDGQ